MNKILLSFTTLLLAGSSLIAQNTTDVVGSYERVYPINKDGTYSYMGTMEGNARLSFTLKEDNTFRYYYFTTVGSKLPTVSNGNWNIKGDSLLLTSTSVEEGKQDEVNFIEYNKKYRIVPLKDKLMLVESESNAWLK